MNGDAAAGERGAQLTALELPDPVGEAHVCRALLPARAAARKTRSRSLRRSGTKAVPFSLAAR